jgi:DNA mismatch repair protein MutL
LFFSPNEIELVRELQLSLENLGFIFDAFAESSIVISGLPITITESKASIVLDDLLTDLQNGIVTDSFSQNDTIAKSMCKSLAVRTGTYLTEKEQESLVHNLFACKEPNVSPFQKPTFITMSVEDLDKKFSI